ncbi:MAG: DUF503 domain-containing protein [Planctomycetes bacterium]|jgi:hypothetical protein|nr:DUF503 domain-containing protein [Planctomycetota bacterium]
MTVGVLRVSLLLRESHSLKDKRRVVRSIKDRVRARLNVAISEVASQDFHQRADLAAVTVSEARDQVDSSLQAVLRIIDAAHEAERFETRMEYF